LDFCSALMSLNEFASIQTTGPIEDVQRVASGQAQSLACVVRAIRVKLQHLPPSMFAGYEKTTQT